MTNKLCPDCTAVARIGERVKVTARFFSPMSGGSGSNEWRVDTLCTVVAEDAPRTDNLLHLCARHPSLSASACLCIKASSLQLVSDDDGRCWLVKSRTADQPESDGDEVLRLRDLRERKGELWRLVETMQPGDSLRFVSVLALTQYDVECEDYGKFADVLERVEELAPSGQQ
jgi:hypothetical protein